MTVLYITSSDFSDVSSGSGVRPYAMYQALLKRGFDVKLLNENTGRGKGHARRIAVRKIEEWLRLHKPDFCYIESPTGPILHNCDYRLIRILHKKKIPTAYFCRDFYRKFPDLFPRRKGFINILKEMYLDFLQLRTDVVLKNVNIVYIPSLEAKKFFNYADVRALPPAGVNRILLDKKINHTVIYVGGISDLYGFDTLLEAVNELNKETEYRLICICRKAEYDAFSHPLKDAEWMEVHHASGLDLQQYYQMASVAVITKKSGNYYNQMAISVKLFEYMSYGLPIVSTSSRATDSFISKNNIGLIAMNGREDIVSCVKCILRNEDTYQYYHNNVVKTLLEDNLWEHRVDQIQKDLIIQ